MDEITTLGVEKLFGIKRARQKEWLMRGHIKPRSVADGQGSKNIFSKNDVCRLLLFEQLLDLGFSRSRASSYVALFSDERASQARQINLESGQNAPFCLFLSPESQKQDKVAFSTGRDPQNVFYWLLPPNLHRYAVIINLTSIVDEVDRKMGS